MTLNTQSLEKAYSTQTQWKWEKKHWLLVLAIGCIALWWFSSQIKETAWLPTITNWLPLIGSLALASETILKLTQ